MLNDRQRIALRILLFRETNARPFLRIQRGDEVKLFDTIHECAAHFRMESEEVWNLFLEDKLIQGWKLSHIKHNDIEAVYVKLYWSTIRPPAAGQKNIRRQRPVKMFDIYTKKVRVFPTLTAAGETIGIKASHVRTRISVPEKIRLLYERYVIIDAEKDFDFLTDEKLQNLFESIKWGVVVFDSRKRTVQRFSGLTAYLRLIDKSYTSDNAMRLLRNKGIYQVDKFRFLMNATYAMNDKTQEELCQLFAEKINSTLFYFR